MTEIESTTLPYELTHDYSHHETGLSVPWGSIRVRIYERMRDVPIVLVSPADNPTRARLAYITPYVAAEVLRRFYLKRLWENPPMRWIEEGIKSRKRKAEVLEVREYWEVFFKSFVPRRTRSLGEERYQIVEGRRRPLALSSLPSLLLH